MLSIFLRFERSREGAEREGTHFHLLVYSQQRSGSSSEARGPAVSPTGKAGTHRGSGASTGAGDWEPQPNPQLRHRMRMRAS